MKTGTNGDASRETSKTLGTRLAIEVSDLKQALGMIEPAIAGRTTVPAMQHVLIERGRMVATDGELRIESTLPGAGIDAPPVLLPGERLARIAGACDKSTELRIEPGKTACTVKNKTGRWSLPTIAADQFPQAAPGKVYPLARIPGDQLARCLKTVIPAVDRTASRHGDQGVLIDVTDGVVNFVGTDGRRLHAYAIEIDQAVDDRTVVIPLRAASTILAIALEAGFEAVQLGASGSIVVASSSITTMTSPTLNMKFPDWRKAIPAKSEAPTRVQAGRLLSATRAAGITTSETSRGVAYAITPEGILLSSKSPEAGESKVACDIYEAGEPCCVTMTPQYVAQFLESLESLEVVDVEVSGPESNVVLRCDDRLCVISPIAA